MGVEGEIPTIGAGRNQRRNNSVTCVKAGNEVELVY